MTTSRFALLRAAVDQYSATAGVSLSVLLDLAHATAEARRQSGEGVVTPRGPSGVGRSPNPPVARPPEDPLVGAVQSLSLIPTQVGRHKRTVIDLRIICDMPLSFIVFSKEPHTSNIEYCDIVVICVIFSLRGRRCRRRPRDLGLGQLRSCGTSWSADSVGAMAPRMGVSHLGRHLMHNYDIRSLRRETGRACHRGQCAWPRLVHNFHRFRPIS